MTKRTSLAALFTTLVISGLVLIAPPASADPPRDCPREYFCAFPGADHMTITYNTGTGFLTLCIHYHPGPGHKTDFPAGAVEIVSVRWRGQCLPGEPQPR